jgi:hypothetical protein
MNDYNCLTCHIIGLNPYSKKELIESLNSKIFNPIDLDEINEIIIKDDTMNSMFKSYQKLKDSKNDKFKEVDKKMTNYWENKYLELLGEQVKLDKKNILVGKNTHFKIISKRINLNTINKFYIKNSESEVKNLIRYNIENYKDDIINGIFPIEYL